MLQGAPITSINQTYINRIGLESENGNISDSTYVQSWNYQGSTNLPKMNFEYSSSP